MSGRDVMQLFLVAARSWLPRIKQATYASEATIEKGQNGSFFVIVRWPATKAGPAGEKRVYFDRSKVLGRTASSMPLQQRPVKKMCRFRDDIIADVLRARGVR